MPELPEVECLRRDLSRTVVGRTIVEVGVRLPKLFRSADGLTLADLPGRRVEGLRRRAKLLIWELSGDLGLVMHLKLAGQLVHHDACGRELAHGGHPVPRWGSPLPHKATHATIRFDDDSILYLTDIRQFGRVTLLPSQQVEPRLRQQRLGPEPLEDGFTWRELAHTLKRRSVPIKRALLDQSVVGGVGNIYADEALWAAKIAPTRPAAALTDGEVKRLHGAIRSVLEYAVREGVAFVPQGRAVSDRAFPYAHGRAGTPCPRCGSLFLKAWVGGRGTHWCPTCQRARVGDVGRPRPG